MFLALHGMARHGVTAVTPGALQLGCGGHCCSLGDPLNINLDQLGSTWAPGNLPKDQRPVVHRHAHCVCHKVLERSVESCEGNTQLTFCTEDPWEIQSCRQHNIMVLY